MTREEEVNKELQDVQEIEITKHKYCKTCKYYGEPLKNHYKDNELHLHFCNSKKSIFKIILGTASACWCYEENFEEQNPCDKCAMKNSNSNYCKNCTVSEYHGKIVSVPTKFIEQESCDDAVSRQAVFKIQSKYAEHIGATKFWQMSDDIKALPSVNPQYTGNEFFNFDAPMVKKSMEQDTVSKKAVLDETIRKNSIWNSITNSEGKNLEKIIFELPSVNPQPSEHFIDGVHAVGYREGYKDAQKQKSGKWIITHLSNMAYCSECDYLFKDIPASIVEQFKYCPNCGARMGESEE